MIRKGVKWHGTRKPVSSLTNLLGYYDMVVWLNNVLGESLLMDENGTWSVTTKYVYFKNREDMIMFNLRFANEK